LGEREVTTTGDDDDDDESVPKWEDGVGGGGLEGEDVARGTRGRGQM
jgi:hypothetical protein